MASTKHRANHGSGRNALPKRFRPLYDQAATETDIRYGGQLDALGGILGQLTRDYGRQAAAQRDAGRSTIGAYQQADSQLARTYTDSGLSPGLLQNIANSPTGQRLAGELAANRASLQQQALGAQAGQQYIQQHLADQYRDDVGQVRDQLGSLLRERGLYQSSLLDQLISGDRSARHEANVAARKQQHDDAQAILDRDAATKNALIQQGLFPGKGGKLRPLPGGKADPNANRGKSNRATAKSQIDAASDFSRALGVARTLAEGEKATPSLRRWIGQQLLNGADAIEGEPLYDTREKINGRINPNYGKPILEPAKLPNGKPNPRAGQKKRTESVEAIPQINNQPIVQAALDMVFLGHLSKGTVQKLHRLGYKTTDFSGVKTITQLRKETRRTRAQQKNPHGTASPPERAPRGARGRI